MPVEIASYRRKPSRPACGSLRLALVRCVSAGEGAFSLRTRTALGFGSTRPRRRGKLYHLPPPREENFPFARHGPPPLRKSPTPFGMNGAQTTAPPASYGSGRRIGRLWKSCCRAVFIRADG